MGGGGWKFSFKFEKNVLKKRNKRWNLRTSEYDDGDQSDDNKRECPYKQNKPSEQSHLIWWERVSWLTGVTVKSSEKQRLKHDHNKNGNAGDNPESQTSTVKQDRNFFFEFLKNSKNKKNKKKNFNFNLKK